jgi:hypothetical protein
MTRQRKSETGKYQPLRKYLEAQQSQDRIRLSFAAIAKILRTELPASAFRHQAWWANQSNTERRSWAAAWLDAGFIVDSFHQDESDGWVLFVRKYG